MSTALALPDAQTTAELVLSAYDGLYKGSCWAWLSNEVRTIDEADQSVKPWPADKLYTKELIDHLEDPTCRLLAIPKSRRVLVSWTVSAWACWRARYFKNEAIFIQSQSESKAAYLIGKRIKFIEDNLATPELRRPYDAAKTVEGEVGKMTYRGTGSYVWAIAEGADRIRAFTFSALLLDESEHQPRAHEALAAALPMVEKGSKLIVVGTSNGPAGILAQICNEVGFTRWGSL